MPCGRYKGCPKESFNLAGFGQSTVVSIETSVRKGNKGKDGRKIDT
jgi:hypothetical protein